MKPIDKNQPRKYIGDYFKTDLLSKIFPLMEKGILKTHNKYSPQEKDALISDENYVLLGRSGTGKTLVAITKMFLLRVNFDLKETKKSIQEINQGESFYLRMIFTTTSPNLIEEVSKYYALMEKKFNEAKQENAKNKNIQTNPKEIEEEKVTNEETNIILPLAKKEITSHTFRDLKVSCFKFYEICST